MSKILIVDDNIDLLDMLKLFLQSKNYIVNVISNWEDIQSSIRSFNPDLILLDISLAGADGRVICKQLKTDGETENIPVLLFSAAYGMKQAIAESFADGFIEKPFEPDDLIAKIDALVSPQQSALKINLED